MAGTQLIVSWDPEKSRLVLFLSFFSNQIHKAKFLRNIRVFVILSRPLNLQDLFGPSKREHIPCIQASLRAELTQPVVPWGNIRHISKLPEGWEENASRCECRFMLPSQPRVCLVWRRSGSSGDLSWEWVSYHLHDCLLGSLQLGLSHCVRNQKKQPWILLFCCCMEAALLIKSEPDLRGNGKETSTLVLADIWELPSSGYNWAFSHHSLPWSLLAWGPERVSGSQVFTNLPAAKVSHTPQGSVFHLLDEGDWNCSRTLVPD